MVKDILQLRRMWRKGHEGDLGNATDLGQDPPARLLEGRADSPYRYFVGEQSTEGAHLCLGLKEP